MAKDFVDEQYAAIAFLLARSDIQLTEYQKRSIKIRLVELTVSLASLVDDPLITGQDAAERIRDTVRDMPEFKLI